MTTTNHADRTTFCPCDRCPGAACGCGCGGQSIHLAAGAACRCGERCGCDAAEQGCLCE